MTASFVSKILSFTPGFSPVEKRFNYSETVLTVSTAKAGKTVGNGLYRYLSSSTGLKPGVNETTFAAKAMTADALLMSEVAQSGPPSTHFEKVSCYYCQATEWADFLTAQDDLTGRPGTFTFITCKRCGLRYQNPRLRIEHVKDFYDNEYIAHRKKTNWGALTAFFNWVMDRHDRQKEKLVLRYVQLGPKSEVLDVGCAVGTFLQKVRARHGARVAGVDFKDLRGCQSLEGVEFHCGLFYEQPLDRDRFDAITMWHFLEHDYDPLRTLQTARDLLKKSGYLVIEVPRLDSLTFRLYRDRWPGVQAPQHTVLYDREMLLRMVHKAGLEVVDYLPYGAFPAFFYFFAGAAFKLLKGKGLNLSRAIYPYFVGQILFAPILAFEKHLNFAMQTVICKRKE